MAIYTKKGDAGMTSLVGGVRVSKADARVDAYGTIDELNSCLSFAAKSVQDSENRELLESIQHQLFYLGAEIASPPNEPSKPGQKQVELEDIQALEAAIDRCMSALPQVNSFVLPGATESGSRLHLARTVARRAERRLVELTQITDIRPVALKYINRMSDFLYAVSRMEDHLAYTESVVKAVVEQYSRTVSTKEEPNMKFENAPNLGFDKIHMMMQQAINAAIKINVPMVISIVDSHGNLIMTYRMPDALLVSIDLAPKKACTAVAMKNATHKLSELIQPGSDLYQLEAICEGKIVTFGGGLPLYHNNKIIGAIGISGGSVQQDVEVAEAAISGLDLEEKQ